jgi:2-polyprenyl-6-methoxyphenol hydroxylase-like FAD-dependent oxidoreductase
MTHIRNGRATVVGAGIGGLTTALLLARLGMAVTLLERVARPAEVGAGLLLQPNGRAVLAGLGLAEEVAGRGHRIARATVRDAAGATVFTVRTESLAVRRSHLLAVLLEAVEADPRIESRFGCEVFAARGDGAVDHAGGTTRGDLVVAADGARSVLRTHGDFGGVVADTGTTYVRGLVDGAGLGLEGEYWTPLGLFGGAPLGDGTTYFYASGHAPPVARAIATGDLPVFRAAWAGALPSSAAVLDRVPGFDTLLVNDVTRVDCGRWADGRVVLVGDAAHAMAPTLGQGANSAMVDAAVLAVELAGEGDVTDALRRYTARRRPRVRGVQDAADRLARMSALTSPLRRAVRDGALRLIDHLPPLAERQARAAQQEDPRILGDAVASL